MQKTKSKITLSEKDLENQILAYLNARGVFTWKNQTIGVWDAKKRIFRKPRGKWQITGVSDILGLLPDGRFLAIEVKSEKNKLRPEHQKEFIERINKNGGLAFFADSLDIVIEKLKFELFRPF